MVCRFDPSRGSESAIKFLEGFSEFLQADGYSAYKTVTEATAIRLVGCWAHARRKFVDADKAAPSEICKDALGR
ncbi:MAG: transposase, partial [Spirochaetales bacterium]|nr:transposase [Spirochaetales bacterium]